MSAFIHQHLFLVGFLCGFSVPFVVAWALYTAWVLTWGRFKL